MGSWYQKDYADSLPVVEARPEGSRTMEETAAAWGTTRQEVTRLIIQGRVVAVAVLHDARRLIYVTTAEKPMRRLR